jgi:hypothetical protein
VLRESVGCMLKPPVGGWNTTKVAEWIFYTPKPTVSVFRTPAENDPSNGGEFLQRGRT